MSNIAIQGAATGTGVFTLASPATNTNRTLTLPDEAGTVLTSAGSLPAGNLTGSVPASAMPAGSVIQMVEATRNTLLTFTTVYPTYTEYVSGAITTTVANSKILICANVPIFQVSAGGWGSSAYHRMKENGSSVSYYEHPGPVGGTQISQMLQFQYLSSAKAIGTYTYTLEAAITDNGGTVSIARNAAGQSAVRLLMLEVAP